MGCYCAGSLNGVEVGYCQDTLLDAPLGDGALMSCFLYYKELGLLRLPASLGMILLLEVPSVLAYVDKYFHISDSTFNVQYILTQFPFDPGANLFLVTVCGTAKNLSVWDPGLYFKSMALTSYSKNMTILPFLGSISTLCLMVYSNSMNKVWDPGRHGYVNFHILQFGCVKFDILQFDFALAVASSLSFTYIHNGRSDTSSNSTKLGTMEIVLPWRKGLFVLLLALPAKENGMSCAKYYGVTTLCSKCAEAIVGFEPENVDMHKSWLGKVSALQNIRSEGARGFKTMEYFSLARGKDADIVQQLQEKPNMERSSWQQGVDITGEIARPQLINCNTSKSSLQQKMNLFTQLLCAKLDKILLWSIMDLHRFPFDPGGILSLQFNSKQNRSSSRFNAMTLPCFIRTLRTRFFLRGGVLL